MINSFLLLASGTKQPGYLLDAYAAFSATSLRDHEGRRGEITVGARGQRRLMHPLLLDTTDG